MSTKKHLTALGKSLDMNALRAKHEKMRAVGNMNVNARGDIIDSNNKVINDNNKRVNVMYHKVVNNIEKKQSAQSAQNNTKTQKPIINNELPQMDLTQSELDEFNDDEPNPKK